MAASLLVTRSTRALRSAGQRAVSARATSARLQKRTSKRKRAKSSGLARKTSDGHLIHKTIVYLPHIDYTVHFRRMTAPPASIPNAVAYIQRLDRNSCAIYTREYTRVTYLAHELVHALAFICEDRRMVLEEEFEHMAYIMQYLMGRALGDEWAN